MKQHLIIAVLAILVSCSPGGTDNKKAEIERYKKKVSNYTQKIAALERELGEEAAPLKPESSLVVEVKQLSSEKFSRHFEVTGYMEAVQDAYISPEINGQIDNILVKRGARVRKGKLLIKLNTDVTEKSIEEVKTNLELATRLYEKQEELWEQNIGSEIQYLEVKNGKESLEARLATLERQLEMAQVRAPFNGIVDDIMVRQGEIAAPGMQLVRLVNLGTMRVSAQVSEAYLNSVKENDMVELRFSSYPDMMLKSGINRLGEVIDQVTRTFTLEVILDNKDERLKPNMLTTVRITDYSENNALVVPTIILKEDFKGTFLFLSIAEGEKNIAQKVYVQRGITVQDQTMILNGINPGDKVIIKGYNLVSDGTPLKVNNI
jgi:RND family efflux transporter MFP subunit